eukprot:NODE_1331_length_1321_cov_1.197218.p1 type:complete len:170 gc:universal NODE_1331_length_1321_cov_1.197218:990-481(-)
MTIKLVSGNSNKIKEWINMMNVEPVKLDLKEIQGTNDEIVTFKCQEAFNQLKAPCIVEDVGLYIDGMNGLPGPYIKHFLPMGLDKLSALKDFGSGEAIAVCTIGYHDGTDIHIFKGETRGKIVCPRGSNFGWDPIFEVDGKTYGERSQEEKNQISHRKKAIMQLNKFLK